jgi:hypothetical protein
MQKSLCRKLFGAVAVSMFIVAASALGQTPSAATKIRAACLKDYRTYCDASARNSVQPACLRQYWTNLSHSCQQALHASESPADE